LYSCITSEEVVAVKGIDRIAFVNPAEIDKARISWKEKMRDREAQRKA
jgi:hypothetical protein